MINDVGVHVNSSISRYTVRVMQDLKFSELSEFSANFLDLYRGLRPGYFFRKLASVLFSSLSSSLPPMLSY
jgi:hypothetical protein